MIKSYGLEEVDEMRMRQGLAAVLRAALSVAVVAGLLLGFALGMLKEWSDDTIYGEQELLKATRLPYLGTFRIGTDSRANPLQPIGVPAAAV